MITQQQAKDLVETHLHGPDGYGPDRRLTILADQIIGRPWGWVFFYQSADYLESGDQADRLAGNAPYMVNKTSGELIGTGSGWPLEKYIEDYETRLLSGQT